MTMLVTLRSPVGTKVPLRRVLTRKVAQPFARYDQLHENFFGGQIAHQLLSAGVTEGAGQCATDLAGNAKRAAVLFRNVYGFDFNRLPGAPGRETKQPFAGSVI